MWLLEQADAAAVLPEIVLALIAMALLMVGVFRKGETANFVNLAALLGLALVALLVIFGGGGRVTAFGGAFVVDTFARVMKVLILFGSAAALTLSVHFMKQSKIEKFEYPILVLLATVGMMMMVSANDLISLYMGLELQSLALYVVAPPSIATMRARRKPASNTSYWARSRPVCCSMALRSFTALPERPAFPRSPQRSRPVPAALVSSSASFS